MEGIVTSQQLSSTRPDLSSGAHVITDPVVHEMLSITLGAALLGRIERLFGPRMFDRLTLLTLHVELDEGHALRRP